MDTVHGWYRTYLLFLYEAPIQKVLYIHCNKLASTVLALTPYEIDEKKLKKVKCSNPWNYLPAAKFAGVINIC